MTTPTIMFVYGFLGAFVVDFEKLYVEVLKRNARPSGSAQPFPQHSVLAMRFVHSLCGGFLAVAWGESFPQTIPLTFMAVGGAAGLIVDRFGQLIAKKF